MWAVSVAIVAVILGLWLIWRKRQFSVFKELGIPGPEPSIFFGNLRELCKEGPLQWHKQWIEQYGPIVGYYFGTKPVILVADVELLKRIQVSEFKNFINRPPIFQAGNNKPSTTRGFAKQLTNLRDKRWKEIRSILTPSFTTSKMKMMAPIMNGAIDSLLENIDKQSKEDASFDIYKMYQGLTMDVIGRTAFGIQTDVQRNPNDPLLRTARAILSGNISNMSSFLAYCFPELGRTLWSAIIKAVLIFHNQGQNPLTELIDSVDNVIKQRRNDKSSRRNDLLQLMMDAEMSETDLKNVTEKNLTAGDEETENQAEQKTKDAGKAANKLLRHMSDREVLDNSVLFFLAGYETTSTALAFVTHFLVHYPEIQERIREEVNDLITSEGELSYTSVNKMQYLDQVINESLRMYPPVYMFINRETREDVTYGNMKIKKGFPIQVAVHFLHHDPKLWPDPEKFDPERFSPANKSRNHPLAWQPFGAGPRNCIGIRFAQMEAKLALARILHKYRLEVCGETDKHPLTLKVSNAIIRPGKGVNVKAVPC